MYVYSSYELWRHFAQAVRHDIVNAEISVIRSKVSNKLSMQAKIRHSNKMLVRV